MRCFSWLFFVCAFSGVASAQTSAPAIRSSVRGDVDGDGFADILRADQSSVSVYRGHAGGITAAPTVVSFTFPHEANEQVSFAKADAWEDLDGDGRAEIFLVGVGRRVRAADVTVRVAVLSGAVSLSAPRVLWQGNYTVSGGAYPNALTHIFGAGELNGDGREDMIAGGFVFLNTGVASSVRGVQASALLSRGGSVFARGYGLFALGDTDRDGRAELWIAPTRPEYAVSYYPGDGVIGERGMRLQQDARGVWNATAMPLFGGRSANVFLADVRVADVDGDGSMELVGIEGIPTMAINSDVPGTTIVRVLRRDAAGSWTEVAPQTAVGSLRVRYPLSGAGSVRCVRDMDGDRVAEVLMELPAFSPGVVGVRSLQSPPAVRSFTMRVERFDGDCSRDVTGDGRVDFVEFQSASSRPGVWLANVRR